MRRHADRIKRNIIEATNRGWKITQGCWVDEEHMECCPLGATLIIENALPLDHDYISAAQHAFDESTETIDAFNSGFDGSFGDRYAHNERLWDAYLFGDEMSTY